MNIVTVQSCVLDPEMTFKLYRLNSEMAHYSSNITFDYWTEEPVKFSAGMDGPSHGSGLEWEAPMATFIKRFHSHVHCRDDEGPDYKVPYPDEVWVGYSLYDEKERGDMVRMKYTGESTIWAAFYLCRNMFFNPISPDKAFPHGFPEWFVNKKKYDAMTKPYHTVKYVPWAEVEKAYTKLPQWKF